MKAAVICIAALFSSSALAAPPPRVVTLAPNLAELVCAVGGCPLLVGVSAYTNYPAAAAKKPQLGDVYALNLEALLALKPSLVLYWDGGTPDAQLQRLRRIGLPIQGIKVEQLEDVAQALRSVGALVGQARLGAQAAARYSQRLQQLTTQYQGRTPVRVLYQMEAAPVYTINGHSPISQAISRCGGVNVFAGLPTLSAPVTDEAVLLAAPQVVMYSERDGSAVQRYWQRLGASPQLSYVDGDLLTRAGPRMVEGVQGVCAALAKFRGQ